MVDVIHDCTQTLELATVKFIALKMLEEGICCSVIARCTGLAKEEIKKLNNHECSHDH